MANLSNRTRNVIVDGYFRGGAMGSTGAVNSTTVVKGIWTASTSYTFGDIVCPAAGSTGAGGKFLQCTSTGSNTSAASAPSLTGIYVGSAVTDNAVTWQVIPAMPGLYNLYVGLLVANKGARANSTAYSSGDAIILTASAAPAGDGRQHLYYCSTAGTSSGSQPTTYAGAPGEVIVDGTATFTELSNLLQTGTWSAATGLTECAAATYTRSNGSAGNIIAALANWAATSTSAGTGSSTGTNGTTQNINAFSFPSPGASSWAVAPAAVVGLVIYDQLTGGNYIGWGALTVPKTVTAGEAPPSFSAQTLTNQIDN